MDVIDLTHTIQDDMQIFPGDPSPSIRPGLTHEKDHCHVDLLKLGSHTGTHIDAPYHFIKNGRRIDEIPARRFVGSGILIDVSGKSESAPIEAFDLQKDASGISNGDFVILKTGWDRYFGTPRYFDHPYLSAGGAELLLQAGAALVGIDALNIDATCLSGTDSVDADAEKEADDHDGYPAHHILMGNDILIVENLCNLDKIKKLRGIYSFLPLKLQGSDGSPIRAVFYDA